MIVLDSSALVAILLHEPEAERFAAVITMEDQCLMSAVSLLEASMVLAGRAGIDGDLARLDVLVSGIEVVPFDAVQALAARAAFLRYGKGRHPAALNMGDCASYALAASRDVPLLFKGNDFARTDLRSASGSP